MPETNTAAAIEPQTYHRDRTVLAPDVHAALERAINNFGGLRGLADAFKAAGCGRITVGAIHQWFTNGIPAHRAVDVERATRGVVKRYELKPELYL